ncbi:MAG: glycosyltransferase [Bacteroidales bacterium]|nr:glycosyltransferase [Bacteroidales bacterium]
MKKICIALPALGCGGTERTAALLGNYFAQKGYSVTFLLLFSGDVFYEIDSKAKIVSPEFNREKMNRFAYLFLLIFFIPKAIKQINPDRLFILGYISLFLFSLILQKKKYKIIISNRASPLRSLFKGYQTIRNLLYKTADGMIAQTYFAKGIYEQRIGHKRITVIPNFLREIHRQEVPKEKIVVTVGRMVPEKGHEYLLKAFAKADTADWKLAIVGGGYLEQEMKTLADELGISEKVIFAGFSKDVDLWLSKSGIFVLSSLTEGYPNALIEAMSLSLPCISVDCVAGPSEIITNNENGILVPVRDENALAEIIAILIANEDLRNKLAENASKINDTNRFEVLAKRYEEFIFE